MLFLGLIIGLLAASVGFMSYTLYRATSDPTFAIEPDYYKKAMNWDQTQRQQAASDALGWAATFAVVKAPGAQTVTRIRLADRDGAPVSGAVLEAVCFPNVRSNDRRTVQFKEGEPGVYESAIAYPLPGRWEFRLSAVRGDSKFIATKELTVPGP